MEYRINPFTRILFVMTILLIVGFVITIRSCNKYKGEKEEYINLISAIEDSISTKINSDSSLTARIETFVTDNKTIRELKTKDSVIKSLQNIIDKNTKSATIFSSNSKTNFKGNTIIKEKDTIYKDSIIYIYPEYKVNLVNKWYNGEIISNKDTTILDLSIHNEYKIAIKKEKKKSFVEVTSMNPYSDISSLRSYIEIENKPKRIGIGVSAGYGAFIDNNIIKLAPYIGASINYNLINIK